MVRAADIRTKRCEQTVGVVPVQPDVAIEVRLELVRFVTTIGYVVRMLGIADRPYSAGVPLT